MPGLLTLPGAKSCFPHRVGISGDVFFRNNVRSTLRFQLFQGGKCLTAKEGRATARLRPRAAAGGQAKAREKHLDFKREKVTLRRGWQMPGVGSGPGPGLCRSFAHHGITSFPSLSRGDQCFTNNLTYLEVTAGNAALVKHGKENG